jgi:formate hydrogenlyase transcriptional activator
MQRALRRPCRCFDIRRDILESKPKIVGRCVWLNVGARMATLSESTSPFPENQYTTLLEVSQAISSHQSLTELFEDLGRRLHTVLNFNYLSLILHDPEHEVMRIHTLHFDGVTTIRPGMEFGVDESPSGEVWRTQLPFMVGEPEQASRFPRAARVLMENGLKSFCSLPLTTARRKIGAMNLGSSQRDAYRLSSLSLLKMVAAQVAVAVENALNYQEVRELQRQVERERDRLKLLLDVNNAVVSNLALPELFRAIPASVRNAMQCDAACLSLPDREQTHLRVYGLDFPAGKGFMQDQMVLPMSNTSPGHAFQTGKPIRFGNAPKSLAPVALKVNAEEGFQSGCFLPIIRRNRTLGVLHLLDRRKVAFSEEDVEFLRQVASQVAIALENALEFSELSESKERLEEEGLYLRDEIRTEHHFEDILGNSAGLRQVLRQVETVAPNETTVLIQGETGTGKELVARAIHALSSRQNNIFVKLNCAAIPLGLLESELFGHERGAFTGAISRKVGRFEIAHKGTLFLDEVGDIPLELQPKLLRVLQEQEFERLGGTRSIRTDVRLIAATNRDLARMMEQGTFRADLYYRLNVFPIHIPPLRERRDDIPILARYFVDKFAKSMNRKITRVPDSVMDTLVRYAWPGNIRELQNFIERAVILTEGSVLRTPLGELREGKSKSSPGATLKEVERKHVLQVLRDTNWTLGGASGAAARLGIPRTTLIYRMRRLGIEKPAE